MLPGPGRHIVVAPSARHPAEAQLFLNGNCELDAIDVYAGLTGDCCGRPLNS